MSSRVFIGNLSSRTSERDVENFFSGYGKIRDVVLKNRFAFVEFSDSRDAKNAISDLNGRELRGDRVVVELARGRVFRGGGGSGGGDRRSGGFDDRRGGGGRYGQPVQTRYRMLVENLSTRCSWQDLKDLMRDTAEVTYADAHKKTPNEAIVCFATHDDLRKAMDNYQGKEINGRRIKLIDDTRKERRKSGSRSRSPRGHRSQSPRSRSRSSHGRGSPSPHGHRSRSPRKHHSRSPHSRSCSSHGHRPCSPRGHHSRSPHSCSPRSRSGSRSQSPPPKRGRSPPGSRSPAENGHK